MCGICGIYGSNDQTLIESMTLALAHRGPDARCAKIVGDRHSLGGARLHITGIASAPFPYRREDERQQVLLNGEIYNFRQWQKMLADEGHIFTTGTDTEVVWALYRKHGTKFVQELKGMFAIAILDGDKVILARDPFGIKPLYYYRKGRQLAFASEIKSLLRFIEKQPRLHVSALQEIITFGFICSRDSTLFEEIQQVKPGEILVFDGENCYTETYYTPLPAFSILNKKVGYREQRLQLLSLLRKSMEVILHHDDQEKGVFLSGGIDSSLMAVLGKEVSGNLKTFTIADDPQAPDLPWSRRVAQAIGSDHYEFKVTFADYLLELPSYVYHYENIVSGGVFDLQGGMAFHLLCKQASQYVKVALTGEGADELFGGYYWTYTHPLGFADRIRRRLQQATQHVSGPELESLVNRLFPLPENKTLYRLNAFDFLLQGGLSNYHLWSVDRSSGAFGFEIRPFYLYDDIVGLGLNTPVEHKVPSNNVTKLILKDVARHYFSPYGLEDVPTRKKYGMPAALSQVNSQLQHYINQRVTDSYFEKHPYRHFLHTKTDLVMFDLFYYIYFHGKGIFDPEFNLGEALAGGIFEDMYH